MGKMVSPVATRTTPSTWSYQKKQDNWKCVTFSVSERVRSRPAWPSPWAAWLGAPPPAWPAPPWTITTPSPPACKFCLDQAPKDQFLSLSVHSLFAKKMLRHQIHEKSWALKKVNINLKVNDRKRVSKKISWAELTLFWRALFFFFRSILFKVKFKSKHRSFGLVTQNFRANES